MLNFKKKTVPLRYFIRMIYMTFTIKMFYMLNSKRSPGLSVLSNFQRSPGISDYADVWALRRPQYIYGIPFCLSGARIVHWTFVILEDPGPHRKILCKDWPHVLLWNLHYLAGLCCLLLPRVSLQICDKFTPNT